MNLSDIKSRAAPLARFFHATGQNGHILGRGQVAHAWMVERGAPPHVTADTQPWQVNFIPDQRTWWTPYERYPHELFRTPLCGNLHTNARHGHLTATWARYGAQCRECEQLVARLGQPDYHEAIAQDPWLAIPTGDRRTTLDPVTGL